MLAASVDQSKVVFGYALAFLKSSPALANEIDDVTTTEIRLKSGIVIAVHANSFRSVRGRTLLCCVFDEVSFWRSGFSAEPDHEVYSAVLPSLATCDGLLVGISSPYRKTGLLHSKHKAFYGVGSNEVLVVQGSSKTFNGSLSDEVIAAQKLADPTASSSEWDAQFRADLVGFLDDAVIDRAVDRARPMELPPLPAPAYYKAFTDASGGAVGGDAYSLCIAHQENQRYIVDVVRHHFGPFDPVEITEEYAKLCRHYRCAEVIGDLYGHSWVSKAWADCGITYTPSDINASMLYLEALPLFTRGLVSLPDHAALLRELRLLERIPGRVGKDQVTHPRNAHDDLANATCGCLRTISNFMGYNLNAMADCEPGQDFDWNIFRLKQHMISDGLQWR